MRVIVFQCHTDTRAMFDCICGSGPHLDVMVVGSYQLSFHLRHCLSHASCLPRVLQLLTTANEHICTSCRHS